MLAPLPLAAAAVCPIERAQYALRGVPDITAAWRDVDSGPDWPSGLALVVGSRRTGRTSWWLPWQGGTDGRTNIASTTDVTADDWQPPDPDDGPRPFGNRLFLTTDAAYVIDAAIPRRGQRAPAHLLAPEAGDVRDDVFPVRQFFDLVRCNPARR